MPPNQKLLPTLIGLIHAAGGDQVNGFHHLFEGGYCIQQFPDELARLACLLSAYAPFNAYLEIGTAAGGTIRFLTEQVLIHKSVVIDDGQHQRFPIWTEHNSQFVPNVNQFIGDSHSPEAALFLKNLGLTFDLVGIDGDHSYEGVLADWNLIQPFISPGSLVWFHDVRCLDEVKRLWQQLRLQHTPILETDGLGIGVLRIQ